MQISRIRLSWQIHPVTIEELRALHRRWLRRSLSPAEPEDIQHLGSRFASGQSFCLGVQDCVDRRGDFSQAALHVSDSAFCQQGPFAPRELPRFPTTTAPSDFRPCGTNWLCIPRRTSKSEPPARRISQVPRFLSRCALSPFTPESRTGAHACVFPARAGFTISDRLAALILVFRGCTGFAFATARTVRLAGPRNSVARLPRLLGYMCHRHFTW
jgi:hypothetical protein